MKRSERHHLKQNVLAVSMAHAEDALRRRRREVIVGVSVTLVLALAIGGYYFRQGQIASRAGALLAEAVVIVQAPVVPPPSLEPEAAGTDPEPGEAPAPDAPDTDDAPPAQAVEALFTQPRGSYASDAARLEAALSKFMAAADAYPSTASGITARYHAAGVLATLGQTDEAARQYREVIERAGSRIYGQMARLGVADLRLGAGDYESAIALLQEATVPPESFVPVDAILMRLGRAYRLAGKTLEALQAFTRIVDEYPGSLYVVDARRELETLKRAQAGG
jgi:tetratricopeptide (TPR) repeat protein